MDAILQEVDRGETAEGFTLFSSWAVPYVVDQIMLNQLEGEDPVEHEVDVFLSQALSETLYLFQVGRFACCDLRALETLRVLLSFGQW
jgi:hypothetical protein